jgi:hypothetical protein
MKQFWRWLGLAALALTLSGCYVFTFGTVRAVPAGPGGPPNSPPTPAIPQIRLEYNGLAFTAEETYYAWSVPNGSSQGSTGGPPGQNVLRAPAGTVIHIVTGPGAPPAALWAAGLNASGVPSNPVMLTPTSTVTPFTLTTPGQYQLQVTAEWTYQNVVTAVFDLDVQP